MYLYIYIYIYRRDMYGYIKMESDQPPGLSTRPGWGAVFGLSMALGGCCLGAGLMATSKTQAQPGRISQSNICSFVMFAT